MTWFTYMVRCKDGTYYSGMTTDVDRRVREHNTSKRGARYTRSRRPVVLAYSKPHASRSEASQAELALKRLTHWNKVALG